MGSSSAGPTIASSGSDSAGFEEFHDPRLASLYDAWGVGRDDTAFYLALAEELQAVSILDVGCGTGQITCALAERGHAVTGVDPAAPMLDVARSRPGGGLVRWIEGDASAFEGEPVDLAIMTAHVAQVIHENATWQTTLAGIARAVRPGGYLAFESRNPDVEGWRAWSSEAPHRRLEGALGPAEVWFDALEIERDAEAGDLARCEMHYRFEATGERLVSRNALRFRPRAVLERDLRAVGFEVERVYGDWDRSALEASSPEMIFVTQRVEDHAAQTKRRRVARHP